MEEKITAAIEKLTAEACDDPMERLKKMILKELEKKDLQLAEGILVQLKTMKTCWKHIVEWARKRAVNNCAMIEDSEVLSEAIHYFVDVDEKPPAEVKKVAAKPKCTPENRPMPKAAASKAEKAKAEEAIISLF